MVRDGVFFPDEVVSRLELNLFDEYRTMVELEGFRYLSTPSLVTRETIERQEVVSWDVIAKVSDTHALAGSAEQGILEHFADQQMAPTTRKVWALNQCFRGETQYGGMKWLREFKKLELFALCPDEVAAFAVYELSLSLARRFLDRYGIKYRQVDMTTDHGYHLRKTDIEVETCQYGWLETHSCSDFGTEQSRRFGITGAPYTVSCTGIASPRILVPFLERGLAL